MVVVVVVVKRGEPVNSVIDCDIQSYNCLSIRPGRNRVQTRLARWRPRSGVASRRQAAWAAREARARGVRAHQRCS